MHASSISEFSEFDPDESSEGQVFSARSTRRTDSTPDERPCLVEAKELVAAFERFVRNSQESSNGRSAKPAKGLKSPKKKSAARSFGSLVRSWLSKRRKNNQVIDPFEPDAVQPSLKFRAMLQAGYQRATST